MEIVKIVKENQKQGVNIKLVFKDGSSFFILQDDKFEAVSKEFVLIEAESIQTGKSVKSIRNIREIRSIDIIDKVNC